MNRRYVLYRRASTKRQQKSGLGLKAQTRAIRAYLRLHPGEIVGRFTEIESGANAARPKLQRAVRRARIMGATLLVSKLDRLARDTLLLKQLQRSGIDLAFADLPSANKFTVGVMAEAAELELERIRTRIKEALATTSKKLGTARPGHFAKIKAKIEANTGWQNHLAIMRRNGSAAIRAKWEQRRTDAYTDWLPKIQKRRERGESYQAIADWLNSTRCPTANGVVTGERFYANTVRRLLNSLPVIAAATLAIRGA